MKSPTDWQQFPFEEFFTDIREFIKSSPERGVGAFEAPAELRGHFDMTLPEKGALY